MKFQQLFMLSALIFFIGCKSQFTNPDKDYKIGDYSIQEIKTAKWFKKAFKSYRVAKELSDSLLKLNEFNILIIGGEWCSDTRTQLPRMVKILESIHFPINNLKFILVDRKKACENCKDYSIEKYQIELVPTIIIFNKSGNEVGRITEIPQKTLEKDLIKIINLP